MKILNPDLDPGRFNERLSSAADRILLIDYDGTLAPFTEERMKAVPYPGVERLVSGMTASGVCRVVVVSGRTIEDLSKLVKFDPMPELWGSHGCERLLPGEKHLVRDPGANVDSFLGKASEWAIDNGLEGRFEKKPVSIAFHWRGGGPGLDERISGMVRSSLLKEAQSVGMEMRRFSGGVELIVSSVNKGSAVDSILDEYGEEAAVAYLGDDNTDEDAFKALGERGLSVLVSEELRDTAADIWIRPPEELVAFLETWADACGVTG